MIKAIETHYAGCRFRSRLEARWAVFFDAVGLEWQYEPEGFELPSGWYLPDFYLPDLRMRVEIKGQKPTRAETSKIIDLGFAVQETDSACILAGDIPREASRYQPAGDVLSATIWSVMAGPDIKSIMQRFPDPPKQVFTALNPPEREGTEVIYDMSLGAILTGAVHRAATPRNEWITFDGFLLFVAPEHAQRLDTALTAARSARFEHGERG